LSRLVVPYSTKVPMARRRWRVLQKAVAHIAARINEDYYRTYMLPLEKYGIKIHHDDVSAAWDRMSRSSTIIRWPSSSRSAGRLNFWRIEAQKDKDFEWFEHKYPGWYNEFGNFYKWYEKLSKPGPHQTILFNQETGYVYPHRCWSCMVPALIREDFCVDEVEGKLYTYCSELCRWTHKVAFASEYEGRATPAMGRFSGRREWEECYHGWDLADCVKDLGFVRNDGKTMISQPHLRFDDKDMWTLDNIRGFKLQSPLTLIRAMSPADRAKHIADYKAGFKNQPGSLAVTVSPGCACRARPGARASLTSVLSVRKVSSDA